MIEYKLVEPEDIYVAEKLRYQAFYMDEDPKDTHCSRSLREGKMLGFLLYDDGYLRAGCYVSMSLQRLRIDYVFVDTAYQHTKKKYGYQILQKVLSSKKLIEEYYGCEINKCVIEPISKSSQKLYEGMGFKEGNLGEFTRHI